MSEITSIPAVAQRFSTNCKKCDSERYHIVLAHVGKSGAKIECEVCHKKSTFKIGAKKKAPLTAAEKAQKKRIAAAKGSMQNWTDLREKMSEDSATPYTIKTKFSSQMALNHPKFGLGYVLNAQDKKIEVVFEDGVKNLIHNQ